MIHRYVATVGERNLEVTVEPLDGLYRVSVEGRVRTVDARRVEGSAWSLAEPGGGRARTVDVDARGANLVVALGGRTVALQLAPGRAALASLAVRPARSGPQPVRAPMPGKVVKLLVQAGDAVKTGQGVVVIEAMKMENELRAPRDGTVASVAVKEGQPVEAGQVLVSVE